MKKIVIAGGNGFLGKALTQYFRMRDCRIVVLSRANRIDHDNVQYVKWNGKDQGLWCQVMEGAEALINLVGKSVDCRYTPKNREEIYDSRLNSAFLLGGAIRKCKSPPKVWINASSATIYRHSVGRDMDELGGELGKGFSVDVCKKWEGVFFSFDLPGVRQVAIRTAIVLGKSGGALVPLLQLAKSGLGGRQGTGKQFVSWLHEDDFCQIIDRIIDNDTMTGIYNLSSPNPIPNAEFMRSLRSIIKQPIGMPLPEFLLKIGAVFIQTEPELILKSRRVVPQRLLQEGFTFKFPYIRKALIDLIKKRSISSLESELSWN